MKRLIVSLAATAAMTFSALSAASLNPDSVKENITPGMSAAQVIDMAGEPEKVKVISGKEVWIYPYSEEKSFSPDLKGEIQIQFSEDSQVSKVFTSDNGLWVWAASSLLVLGIIFI